MRNRFLAFTLFSILTLNFYAPAQAVTTKTVNFKAEIWADNWFALYINGKKVGEDSVSIASTKNSLLLRLPDAWPIVAQLVPTGQRWQEQTITNTEDDPLFDSVFFGKEKGIGKPLILLQYDYPLYSDAPEGTCDLGAWD